MGSVRPLLRIVEPPGLVGITKHEKMLRRMPCMVSGSTSVTLHHCKGGSMRDMLGCAGAPGGGKKVSDWLQIPLNWRYHTGDLGIDTGQGIYKDKRAWEAAFGTQVSFLVLVSQLVGYDVFRRAGFKVDLPELLVLP
jgi:hypothetical protein